MHNSIRYKEWCWVTSLLTVQVISSHTLLSIILFMHAGNKFNPYRDNGPRMATGKLDILPHGRSDLLCMYVDSICEGFAIYWHSEMNLDEILYFNQIFSNGHNTRYTCKISTIPCQDMHSPNSPLNQRPISACPCQDIHSPIRPFNQRPTDYILEWKRVLMTQLNIVIGDDIFPNRDRDFTPKRG